MRVCSPQLGLAPESTLGGEVFDREILTRMAGRRVEVEVLLPSGLPCAPLPGGAVTRLPLSRGYRWFVSNPLFVPYVGAAYRRQPFDVLRVHSLRFTGLAACWARRLYRLPVPIIAHHHHIDRDRWTDRIDRRAAHCADLVITGSRFSRNQVLTELGLDPERVVVAYYGVDDRYRPISADEAVRAQYGLLGKWVLLHVGSLKPRKNLPVLLRSFCAVLQNVPEARLVLVGRGPDEMALRALARELGVESAVVWAGYVTDETKHALYGLTDVFCSASRMEGFGLAVAEAMGCGVPVVSTGVGSIPEVVANGETGLLVSTEDADALTHAILRLRDDDLARRMGRAAVARVDARFRWDRCVGEMIALYQRATADWRKGHIDECS